MTFNFCLDYSKYLSYCYRRTAGCSKCLWEFDKYENYEPCYQAVTLTPYEGLVTVQV